MSNTNISHSICSKHEFDSVNPDAIVMLEGIANKIVDNALKNVCEIASVCGCKVVNEQHLRLLSHIENRLLNNKTHTQSGGAETVLPMEYFSGKQSGNYYDHSIVESDEANMEVNPDVITRPAMPLKFVETQYGGNIMFMPTFVDQVIKAKMNKGMSCKLSKQAKAMIVTSLNENMNSLLESVSRSFPKASVLSCKMIYSVVNKQKQFVHLR